MNNKDDLDSKNHKNEEAIDESLTEFVLLHYKKILVLEKNESKAPLINEILQKEGYNVNVVTKKEDAINLLDQKDFDIIIVSEDTSADGLFLRDEIRKRGSKVEMKIIKDFGSTILLSEETEEVEKWKNLYFESLILLTKFLEIYDPYLFGHSEKVAKLSNRVANKLKLSKEDIDIITISAFFHDIPQLLNDFFNFRDKTLSKLNLTMLRYPKIVKEDFFKLTPPSQIEIKKILRHIKERYDGKGYPDGLKGDDIPLGSRIIGVVDIYVHMISGSATRRPMKRISAMNQLVQNAGQAFDPKIVETLIEILKEDLKREDTSDVKDIILIVDKPEENSLLKLKLEDEGYKVINLNSINEAIEFVKVKKPELIISEIELPDSDGFVFLEYLSKYKSTSSIPLIFLTYKNDPNYMLRGLRLGAEDFITKPYNVDLLFIKIKKILDRESKKKEETTIEKRGVHGTLLDMGILEIIQILGTGAKTAKITVTRGNQEGVIYMQNGQIIYAELGDELGEDALFRMMSWNDGDFIIESTNVKPPEKNIFTSNEILLLKVMHRLDEARRRMP